MCNLKETPAGRVSCLFLTAWFSQIDEYIRRTLASFEKILINKVFCFFLTIVTEDNNLLLGSQRVPYLRPVYIYIIEDFGILIFFCNIYYKCS
jgi:hypothetical protein